MDRLNNLELLREEMTQRRINIGDQQEQLDDVELLEIKETLLKRRWQPRVKGGTATKKGNGITRQGTRTPRSKS